MTTRRQREAPAPRPAANAGPGNQTAASTAARSGPRNQTAAAAAGRSGPRNQTVAAARSGPRNQTVAAAASRSGPRNQTAAAAAPSRPRNQTAAAAPSLPRNQTTITTASNRRALGDISNQVNAPVVDGEANRCRITRSLNARPNAAAADENTIAPAHPATAVEGVGMAVSGQKKKLSKEDNTKVTRAEMDAIVDSVMKIVAETEAIATNAVESMGRSISVAQRYEMFANWLQKRYEEIAGDNERLYAETNQLESEKAQKESQVQQMMEENVKVMEENVRLHAMLDKKEAQLQAMSEQCKLMALNHHN